MIGLVAIGLEAKRRISPTELTRTTQQISMQVLLRTSILWNLMTRKVSGLTSDSMWCRTIIFIMMWKTVRHLSTLIKIVVKSTHRSTKTLDRITLLTIG